MRTLPAFLSVVIFSAISLQHGVAQVLIKQFHGGAAGDHFGQGVNGAGDTNQDGFDDIIVGAPGWDESTTPQEKGHIYVFSVVPGIYAPAIFEGQGPSIGDKYGDTVSGAGDTNLDGFPDVIAGTQLGEPDFGNTQKGEVYIDSGNPAHLNPLTNHAAVLKSFTGAKTGDQLGNSVCAAGDINGDGYPDVVMGAVQGAYTSGPKQGFVQVRTGGPVNQVLYQFQGLALGDYFGDAVGGTGDIDADGIPDVVVGASQVANGGTGYVQVFSGANGALLYTLFGEAPGDLFGVAVCHAGDVNFDGHADFLVGAPKHDGVGVDSGRAYLYSGKDGSLLFQWDGEAAGDQFGITVSSTAYISNDSHPRILIGAPKASHGGAASGSAYVYSSSNGALLKRFDGFAAGDEFGTAVGPAGDFDADGHIDLVVGAPFADNNGIDSGTAYVFSIPDYPGIIQSYGDSCQGSAAFKPKLSMAGAPLVGTSVTMTLQGTLGSSVALIVAGLSQDAKVLPNGCTLLVGNLLPGGFAFVPGGSFSGSAFSAQAIPQGVTNGGKVSVVMPITSAISTLTFQGLLYDAHGHVTGTSNGVILVVGD